MSSLDLLGSYGSSDEESENSTALIDSINEEDNKSESRQDIVAEEKSKKTALQTLKLPSAIELLSGSAVIRTIVARNYLSFANNDISQLFSLDHEGRVGNDIPNRTSTSCCQFKEKVGGIADPTTVDSTKYNY
jgi:hypothetical protein